MQRTPTVDTDELLGLSTRSQRTMCSPTRLPLPPKTFCSPPSISDRHQARAVRRRGLHHPIPPQSLLLLRPSEGLDQRRVKIISNTDCIRQSKRGDTPTKNAHRVAPNASGRAHHPSGAKKGAEEIESRSREEEAGRGGKKNKLPPA